MDIGTLDGKGAHAQRAMTAWPVRRYSAAVVAVAIYVGLGISRIPELLPTLRPSLIVGCVAVALAIVLPPVTPRLFRLMEVRAVLWMLLIGILTIPFSVWPGGSFDFVVNSYSKLVVLFLLVAYSTRSLHDCRVIVRAFLAAILWLELETITYGPLARSSEWGGGSYYDANDMAFIMACAIPLAVVLAWCRRGVERYLASTVAVLAVVVAVWTQSRGGFVALATVAVFVCLRLSTQGFGRRVGVLMAFLLVVAMFASPAYWDRIGTIWGGEASQSATAEYDSAGLWGARWDTWMNGLTLILNNPALGVGAGVYTVGEGALHGGAGKWSAAHNAYLQIGGELGVPGLALFVVLLVLIMRNCQRVRRSQGRPGVSTEVARLAGAVEVSVWGYVVAAISLSIAYSHVLYLLAGLSVALARIAESAPSPRRTLGRHA